MGGSESSQHQFVLADHLAFRVETLDDLRSIATRLADAGVDNTIPISHGNAWSVYFNDPEGNGLECFVDTPFHVAQPYGESLDLGQSNEAIELWTRDQLQDQPEFQPFDRWKADFAAKLSDAGQG